MQCFRLSCRGIQKRYMITARQLTPHQRIQRHNVNRIIPAADREMPDRTLRKNRRQAFVTAALKVGIDDGHGKFRLAQTQIISEVTGERALPYPAFYICNHDAGSHHQNIFPSKLNFRLLSKNTQRKIQIHKNAPPNLHPHVVKPHN